MKYIPVSKLSKFCPAYLRLSETLPVRSGSIEAALGVLIHRALVECLKGADVDEAVVAALSGDFRTELERRVAEHEAMQKLIHFYTERGCGYIRAKALHEKKRLKIEMPVSLEMDIGGEKVKISGKIDAFDPKEYAIYDWKTGAYLAQEHVNQMEIYAVLLTDSGISEPPYLVRLVYIGVSYPFVDEVMFVIDEDDVAKTRARMLRTLSSYITNEDPPISPSDACTFCPYQFRCAAMKVFESGDKKEKQIYRQLSLQDVTPVSAGEKAKMWKRLSAAYNDIGLYFLQKSSEASKRANGEKVEEHRPAVNTYFPMDYILRRLARIPLEDLRDVVADIFINMGAIKGKMLAKYFTNGKHASRYFKDD